MKLPFAEQASVPEHKLTQYLLNPAHPAGGSKALFFLKFGFLASDWPRLASALLQQARDNEITETERTAYGVRYVIDGLLSAPDGTLLNIRSAWYIRYIK